MINDTGRLSRRTIHFLWAVAIITGIIFMSGLIRVEHRLDKTEEVRNAD